MKTIKLLELDSLLSRDTISTLTFYNGNASSIDTFLKQRVYDIIELNPWLLGSVRNDFGSSDLNLTYSNDSIENEFKLKRTFVITEDSQLNECVDYDDIAMRIKNLNILINEDIVNRKDESLFRVGLIRISSTKFAILFSFHHIIGDTHTLYQLFGMLSERSKPRALIIDRVDALNFNAMKDELNATRELSHWAKPSLILKLELKHLFCKYYTGTMHSVDLNAIEEVKLEYKKQSPDDYISTNDILTSWYFNNFKIDVGVMPVNCRGRFPALTQDHAGNYLYCLICQKNNFDNPSKVRESMKSLNRMNSDVQLKSSSPFVSSFQCTVSGKKFGLLTSWVSLYMDVELSDCNQILHLPIYVKQNVMRFGVLFRAKKDEIKILTYSKDKTLIRRMVAPRN